VVRRVVLLEPEPGIIRIRAKSMYGHDAKMVRVLRAIDGKDVLNSCIVVVVVQNMYWILSPGRSALVTRPA
jgi:hypothetical protein